MRELRLVLSSAWEPARGAARADLDACAFRVVSLLGSRASQTALADELGRIRRDQLAVEPDRTDDVRAAEAIAAWFHGARA